MKNTARAMVALGLAAILAGAPEALLAARSRGAKLVVTLNTGEVVKGELVGVREETLVLLTDDGDRVVSVKDTARLLVRNGSGYITGALVGLGAGAGADVALWHSYRSDKSDVGQFMQVLLSPGMYLVMALVAVAAGGTGALIGHGVHKGKTYEIGKMTGPEVRAMLMDLRGKAMVPNYK